MSAEYELNTTQTSTTSSAGSSSAIHSDPSHLCHNAPQQQPPLNLLHTNDNYSSSSAGSTNQLLPNGSNEHVNGLGTTTIVVGGSPSHHSTSLLDTGAHAVSDTQSDTSSDQEVPYRYKKAVHHPTVKISEKMHQSPVTSTPTTAVEDHSVKINGIHAVSGMDNQHNDHKSANSSAGKTPRSSSVTNTNSIRFKTCCGTVELSWLKIMSIVSMSINIFAFVLLAILIAISYSSKRSETDFLTIDSDTTTTRETMKWAARAAVYTNFNPELTEYYAGNYTTAYDDFLTLITEILTTVPAKLQYHVAHNVSLADLRTTKALATERTAIAYAQAGNFSVAMNLLEGSNYKYYCAGYDIEFAPLVAYIGAVREAQEATTLLITTIALIVICVSIAVVLPVVIASVVMSITKDTTNNKKLRKVNAFLLMDTMRDERLRQLFRGHCINERSEENFQCLDKIVDYKCLCERSFDIQSFLYDTDLSSDGQISEAGSTSSSEPKKNKKKKKGYTEKDLGEIEKKKFEIAFEIFTDFLEVSGEKSVNINKSSADTVKQQLDYFATGQNDHLSDTLFDSVESEICIVMLDSHHRFKQSLETQKQAKKEFLTKLKNNKKKSLR